MAKITSLDANNPQHLLLSGFFGDTVDIGNFNLIPVNNYDNFFAMMQWNGTTGIPETDTFVKEIFLYPNPAKNILHINTANQTVSETEIIDLTGKTVVKQVFPETVKSFVLNIPELHNGLYLVRVKTIDGKELTQKLIIEK